MLKMENASKSYQHRGQTVVALNNATVHIPRGDFVSVVGPSGSGKSTLLLMLGGMLSPSQGRILVEDQSVYDLNLERSRASSAGRRSASSSRRSIWSRTFRPWKTCRFRSSLPRWTRRRRRTAPRPCWNGSDLADRLDHKPCELSVGQQQRVALARMLANDPAVILADEPTGNLDPETSRQIIGYLEEFNGEGRTIVMVTHDPRAAKRAKRILRLKDGTIVNHEAGEDAVWAA